MSCVLTAGAQVLGMTEDALIALIGRPDDVVWPDNDPPYDRAGYSIHEIIDVLVGRGVSCTPVVYNPVVTDDIGDGPDWYIYDPSQRKARIIAACTSHKCIVQGRQADGTPHTVVVDHEYPKCLEVIHFVWIIQAVMGVD